MGLKEQIDLIIAARKEKSAALKARKDALLAIKAELKEGCAALTMQAKEITDETLRAQYVATFSGLDSRSAQKLIDAALRKLDDGIKRFDRDYISIATVGKERQGKSQFLQSVGDLDNSIIPAYDATSCTGATSIIWNDPSMPKGAVRATIHFRQPTEILEFVHSYVSEIDPAYVEGDSLRFDDVGYINLSALEVKMEKGNAKQASAMKHLTGIVEHFDEIRDLFGASPVTLTDPNLIKTFVAQNNGKKDTDPELERYFKYLAVARADIYCPFFADVGRIRLVDTVGIGDTKYGIEDAMLNTVDRECDAAIVVTRPISGVQVGDQDLYNSLREKFKLRDTALWLFYLVNHFKGQNDNTVEAFAREVKESGWAVAECGIVDASDQSAVKDGFVVPMLRTLVENMEKIDGGYLQEIDEKEEAARLEVKKFLDGLPHMEKINTNALLGQEAYEKGRACFNRMTADLSNAVYHWSQEKEKYNSALWNNVQAILSDIDSIIPSAEQIQAISDSNGALLGEDIWQMVLHNVRNEITDRFIIIDDVLEKATLDFKNSLVKTLYDELRALSADGGALPEEDEECDMVEWLKTMMDGILSSDPRYNQIRKAFNFLYQFQFNTRAQLIQEVRRQLYIINPICGEYAKPSITFHKSNCGKTVHFYLTSRMSVIEDELRYHLAKLYRTPNMAFYAAAEEFYDRLAFASDLSGGSLISMSDVWGMFFQVYSSQIWKEDTERFDVVNKLIERYGLMIGKLRECLASEAS